MIHTTLLVKTLLLASCLALAANSQAASKKRTHTKHTKHIKLTPAAHVNTYAHTAAAQELAAHIATARNLDLDWVRAQIAQAQHLPRVVQLMTPGAPRAEGVPAPRQNWQAYRGKFLTQTHINAGVVFWQTNQDAMAKAEAQYGVPQHIIAGILGVETIYGRNVGSFRVLDALATLAFDYPKVHPRRDARVAYFRGELEHFLVLSRQLGREPSSFKGSFAGAMGLPQFMPSSWNNYAVDFDGDGQIDLWQSPSDAIGSVANYFKGYGWKPHLATHTSLTQWDGTASLPAGHTLIELENGLNEPTRIGATDNFFVITKYNNSYFYAAAVIELGAAVAAAYSQIQPKQAQPQ
jgi:membrane-bound lytic murein transglycosylase B